MFSTRSPLKNKSSNVSSTTLEDLSLCDKENTVSYNVVFIIINNKPVYLYPVYYINACKSLFHVFLQPPSLNTTRILASKTARKIFDDSEVSLPFKLYF